MKAPQEETIGAYTPVHPFRSSPAGNPLLTFTTLRLPFSGYEVSATTREQGIDPSIPVVVATAFDERVDEYLSKGGTVLLLVTDPPQVSPGVGLTIGENICIGGVGGWPIFIDKSFGLFERIPFDNPVEWPFYRAYSGKARAGLSLDELWRSGECRWRRRSDSGEAAGSTLRSP